MIIEAMVLLGLLAVVAPQHLQGKQFRRSLVDRVRYWVKHERVAFVFRGPGQQWLNCLSP